MSEDETERLAAEAVRYALGHQSCPSCASSPGVCCRCRGTIELRLQGLTEDLVEALRRGLDRGQEHLWCSGCLRAYTNDLSHLHHDIRARGGEVPGRHSQTLLLHHILEIP